MLWGLLENFDHVTKYTLFCLLSNLSLPPSLFLFSLSLSLSLPLSPLCHYLSFINYPTISLLFLHFCTWIKLQIMRSSEHNDKTWKWRDLTNGEKQKNWRDLNRSSPHPFFLSKELSQFYFSSWDLPDEGSFWENTFTESPVVFPLSHFVKHRWAI